MTTVDDQRIAELRAFNRFYTRRIGVLSERPYDERFTLPETRVLWELAHEPGMSASRLGELLDLDAGYLSRLLAGLRKRGYVNAARSSRDRRQSSLSLTPAGLRAFAPIDGRTREQIAALFEPLPEPGRRELVESAARIRALLGEPQGDVILRDPLPGDLGWVVSRNGALYAEEYGWDLSYEGLVARICADFAEHFDPAREHCWIAERGGERVGAVFIVKTDDVDVARLRLLLVEPSARGMGLGRRLVDECTAFAREVGYRRIRLWTNSVLEAARHIYASSGYRLVSSEPHESFGHSLVGETWELELAAGEA